MGIPITPASPAFADSSGPACLLGLGQPDRNLKPQVEEAEPMLTQIEIERTPSYVIGVERGT